MNLKNFAKGSRIDKKLVVIIILFSSIITLIISAVQLYFDYRAQYENLRVSLEKIAVFVPGITRSVWNFNEQQIVLALEALVQLPEVQRAVVTVPGQDITWSVGSSPDSHIINKVYSLHHQVGDRNFSLGTLEVVAGLDTVYQSVATHALGILLGNALKTILVAIFMFYMLRRTVSNRVDALTRKIARLSPLLHAHVAGSASEVATKLRRGDEDELDVVERTFDDINKRLKTTVVALRSNRRLLQSIIDNSTAIIFVKNLDGRFLLVNRRCLELFHFERNEMLGKTDFDIFPKEYAEAYHAADQRVLTTGEARSEETVVPHDNIEHTYIALKAPLRDEAGRIHAICGIATDITERKKAEQELQQHRDHLGELVRARTIELTLVKEQADAANRAKSVFLANMSHELRTPLNAIIGYTQVLKRDKNLNERELAILGTIQQSGEHLQMLINDTLDLSKIEAGKLELYSNAFNLLTFMQMITDIGHFKSAQKNLQFACDLAPDLPQVIRADATRLRQILLNLLSNAIKFTDHGRVDLRVQCAPFDDTQIRLRFAVQDTGIGIDRGDLIDIFQAFEQVGNAQRRHGGTGLGLSISRQLVRLMGGDIHVESHTANQPDAGSLFWFEIVVPLDDDLTEIPAAREVRGYIGSRKKVLVVDDDAANRALLTAFLEPLGFDTLIAHNGAQALLQIQDNAPDLVVMNLLMSQMDGLEATRRIRLLPEHGQIPIVLVSTCTTHEDEVASLAAGADAFLPRPIRFDDLLKKIGELLPMEWEFVSPKEAISTAVFPTATAILPSQALLEELHELALSGDMHGIRDWATQLAEKNEAYRPFAEHLCLLANAYQSQAIVRLAMQSLCKPT